MENKKTDPLTDIIQNSKILPHEPESTDDWELTQAQLAFMRSRHDQIEHAYKNDDDDFFTQLMESAGFIRVFGSMSWDEAYDRYEVWLENQT